MFLGHWSYIPRLQIQVTARSSEAERLAEAQEVTGLKPVGWTIHSNYFSRSQLTERGDADEPTRPTRLASERQL